MRVGLVIYGDLAITSGGYRYDRHLVDALVAAGHRVDIIALPWRSYVRHLTDNLAPDLARRLSRTDLDLVLQDELNHPSLALTNRRRPTGLAPIAAVVHHLRVDEAWPWWQRAGFRIVERAYLRSADAYLANSPTTLAAVHRLAGVTRPAWVAVPGRDRIVERLTAATVRARAQTPGPLRILFVGNVMPRKGLHTLITALAMLPPDAWQLDVVGSLRVDRAYARAIGAQLARAGLASAVRLHGALPDQALASQYRSAHLLAMPSAFEGFGIVYLEGMGYGLPAIATAAGGARDLVAYGQNGFLVPPAEPATVASLIGLLARDRRRLATMACAALDTFRRHPTWDETMAGAVRFLEQVARR